MSLTIKEMIDAIREAVSNTDRNIPERDVMEALVNEAEGWRMRLDELEDDDEP